MPEASRRRVKVEFHDDNNGLVKQVQVPERTLITEAATAAGLRIPTLCHHPRLAPAGRCGLCVCSVENGPTPTQLACSTYVKAREGDDEDLSDSDDSSNEEEPCKTDEEMLSSPPDMIIHINGTDLNDLSSAALKRSMDRTLAYQELQQKGNHFAACGTLEIEEVGNLLQERTLDTSSAAITYDPSLCIGCSRCVRACDQLQGMHVLDLPIPDAQPAMGITHAPPCLTTRSGRPLRDTDCISCGQCTLFCPTGAIREVDHTARVMQALSDPNQVVVLQTAPSARVTISEMFGGAPGACSQGQLVGAAKASGFDYVFDTLVGADLTIMEEAHELLQRIEIDLHGTVEEKNKMPLPMFTSCCPGWINLVEQSYPQLIPHLSTCRSPMGMLSRLIREVWWPKQEQARQRATGEVDQSNLYVVAVMPCTAKKDEIARPQLQMPDGTPETNAVLTVREFARLLELKGAAKRKDPESFANIVRAEYDNPFGDSTGAAAIFGVTGGVAEAALRTAADVLTGQSLSNVTYETVRGLSGIKEATISLTRSAENDSIDLNLAVCNQMANVKQFLAQMEDGNREGYQFVEVMTCPGGCVGGGGLPQSRDPEIISKRVAGMYSIDERKVKRKSHESEDVKRLYENVLGSPLSDISHKFLHTNYTPRRRKPLPRRRVGRKDSVDSGSYHTETTTATGAAKRITVIYGTLSGTSKRAAKQVAAEIKNSVTQSDLEAEAKVTVIPGNAVTPEKLVRRLRRSFLTVFVTPTYDHADGGCFPDQLAKFWEHLDQCDADDFDSSMRFAVFGLGSTMYAGFEDEFFNKAGKALDQKLEDLGGQRLIPLGLGDDMDERNYRDGLDRWLQKLGPAVVKLIELETNQVREVPSIHSGKAITGKSEYESTDSGSSHSYHQEVAPFAVSAPIAHPFKPMTKKKSKKLAMFFM